MFKPLFTLFFLPGRVEGGYNLVYMPPYTLVGGYILVYMPPYILPGTPSSVHIVDQHPVAAQQCPATEPWAQGRLKALGIPHLSVKS